MNIFKHTFYVFVYNVQLCVIYIHVFGRNMYIHVCIYVCMCVQPMTRKMMNEEQ